MYCVIFVTTAAQPLSIWATTLHHMAPFPDHTLWIPPAPEEFCASVPVQLWGVAMFSDARGAVVWLLSLLANSTKFQYGGQPHPSEIFIRDLTKRWKINESLFSWSSRFSDCFIKFTWEFHLMCAQSIMVILSSTASVWPERHSAQRPSTTLRISVDRNYHLAID